MYQPIHLKYRPQTLSEIIGQETTVTTLKNAVTEKMIAPSYLFIGSRGTGKTSTARILAKMINCQGEAVPCNICESCVSINKGNHLDVIEIDAASNSGVEAMREIIERTQFASVAGGYKVIIIDECHSLSGQAWQSLLKTTENPPPNVVFIFCTTESGKVPETIVSRSQSFEFKLIGNPTIVKNLLLIANKEGIELEEDGAVAIAKVKNGHIRDSQTLLDQLRNLNRAITKEIVYQVCGVIDKSIVLEILVRLGTNDYSKAIEIVKNLISKGKNPHKIITTLIEAINEVIIDEKHPVKEIWNNQELQRIIKVLNDKQHLVKGNFAELWLESILIEIARFELDKKFIEIHKPWKTIDDALSWGESELPQIDVNKEWEKIVPIEGKRTPGWINFILREKILSSL